MQLQKLRVTNKFQQREEADKCHMLSENFIIIFGNACLGIFQEVNQRNEVHAMRSKRNEWANFRCRHANWLSYNPSRGIPCTSRTKHTQWPSRPSKLRHFANTVLLIRSMSPAVDGGCLQVAMMHFCATMHLHATSRLIRMPIYICGVNIE